MTRLKRFAGAMLAAATVVSANLAMPSTASAMDCRSARLVEDVYLMTAYAFLQLGMPISAVYWSGKAEGIIAGACG